MAKLLLISDKTYHVNVNEIGDVVGVFEDSHIFSRAEREAFEILQIKGLSREEVAERLNSSCPEIRFAWKSATTEWTLSKPEEKELWKNPQTKWCFIEQKHKHLFTCTDMGNDIKTALADPEIDKASKLVLIDSNIKETISRQPENYTEVPNSMEPGK